VKSLRSLERLLALGGVLEVAAGLGLLVAPSLAATLVLGTPLIDAGATFGRLGGGGLLALGISCWSARGSAAAPVGRGVAYAFLAYNVIACLILALAVPALPGGLVAVGASLLHAVLAVALSAALFTTPR
jgi:hypothetical protein